MDKRGDGGLKEGKGTEEKEEEVIEGGNNNNLKCE